MNRKADTLEQDLNITRIKLYEQTKNMTTEDRVAFFNTKGRAVLARHGINAKIVELPIVRQKITS